MRIKTITLKKMSATDFAALLKKLGACPEARKWAKGKTLQQVWKTCERGDWMHWLLTHTGDERGWPHYIDTRVIRDEADSVFWIKSFLPDKNGLTDDMHMANILRKYIVFK